MRPNWRSLISSSVLIAPLVLAACGDSTSDPDQNGDTSTPTEPEASIITEGEANARFEAGDALRVSCLFEGDEAFVDAAQPAVNLESRDGAEVNLEVTPTEDGFLISGTQAGRYTAFCADQESGEVDAVGLNFTITPGAPVKTKPVFDLNPIQAGEITAATCQAEDAHGNIYAFPNPHWVLGEDVTLHGEGLSSTRAGSHPVNCGAGTEIDQREIAYLHVRAAEATQVFLSATPEQAFYLPGDIVSLSWAVFDPYDNPIEEADGEITAAHPQAERLDGDLWQYRLPVNGAYPFTFSLAAPYEALSAQLTLTVASEDAAITILSPQRGQSVRADGQPLIVSGEVSDAALFAELAVNGTAVTIEEDGSFDAEIDVVWGINQIRVEGQDLRGQSLHRQQSFIYAEAFRDPTDPDTIPQDAIQALLGPAFFEDAADIALDILHGMDLRPAASDSLRNFSQSVPLALGAIEINHEGETFLLEASGDLQITVEDVNAVAFGELDLALIPRDGGLNAILLGGNDAGTALNADLGLLADITLNLTGDACGDGSCPLHLEAQASAPFQARLSADHLDATLNVDLAQELGEELTFGLDALTPSASGFRVLILEDPELEWQVVSFDGPALAPEALAPAFAFADNLAQQVREAFNPQATDTQALINQWVRTFAIQMAPSFLGALDALDQIDYHTTVMDPYHGTPITFRLQSGMTASQFSPAGNISTFSAAISTDQILDLSTLGPDDSAHATESLGTIVRGDCLGDRPGEAQWDLNALTAAGGLALHVDLLNELAYAAWQAGSFNGEVDLAYLAGNPNAGPFVGLQTRTEWLLPPVANDCDPDQDALRLTGAEVYVHITGEYKDSPVDIGLYADFDIRVAFEIKDLSDQRQELIATFIGVESAGVDIHHLEANPDDRDELEALILTLPLLSDALFRGHNYPFLKLPQPSLSILIPGAAGRIHLEHNDAQSDINEGYIYMLGGILIR